MSKYKILPRDQNIAQYAHIFVQNEKRGDDDKEDVSCTDRSYSSESDSETYTDDVSDSYIDSSSDQSVLTEEFCDSDDIICDVLADRRHRLSKRIDRFNRFGDTASDNLSSDDSDNIRSEEDDYYDHDDLDSSDTDYYDYSESSLCFSDLCDYYDDETQPIAQIAALLTNNNSTIGNLENAIKMLLHSDTSISGNEPSILLKTDAQSELDTDQGTESDQQI